VGKLLVAGIVATYGVSMIAANAAAGSIVGLFNLPGDAVSLSMVAVIGQCVGAGATEEAKYYAKRLMKLAYMLMLFSNSLLFLTARPAAMIFGLSPEAANAAVELLRYSALFSAAFWPSSFAFPNALRAAGDAKYTMGVSVLCMWICRIGLSYLLAYAFDLGLLGVWIAMFIDWFVRSACFLGRYRSGKWLRHQVI
jgi:Na+-driven multidrug efflux pump